jgi:TonB family protein
MRQPFRLLRSIASAAIFSCPPAVAVADSASPAMPAIAKPYRGESFPPAEKRRNHEGSVVVEFSIDTTGRTNSIEAIESSSAQFSAAAMRMLKGTRFKVTKEWIGADGPATRYRLGFAFDLEPCDAPATPWGGDIVVLTICSMTPSGSPPPQVLERR